MDTSFFENVQPKENSLPERVADQISRLIVERQLSGGDKLPNEFELAEQLHVGRGTIREAVKLLVSRNVLVIRRGIGTYIANRPGQIEDPLGFAYYPDQTRLCMDLLEVRTNLEPWVAATAAERATQSDMEILRDKCLVVERDILEGKDHLPNDKEFHIAVAQCTQNMVVPSLIPIITFSVGLFGTMTEYALRSETIVDHRAITDAICRHDAAEAERRMRQHLEKNRVELERVLREMDSKNQAQNPRIHGFSKGK